MSELRRLRYKGRCIVCGSEVAAGVWASYNPETKKMTCASCVQVKPTSPHPTPIDRSAPAAAGLSAKREADRSAAIADKLASKAAWAAQRASAFEKGAEGEQLLASAVAPLSTLGWFTLHDRAMPGGGNVDHLLVGPAGVFVVDAKNWSTDTTATASVLRSGGQSRTRHLDGLHRQLEATRAALNATPQAGTPVLGVLALVGEYDHAKQATAVTGVDVIGLDHLPAYLRAQPSLLSRTRVEEAVRLLSTALPPAGEARQAEVLADRPLFDATHRFLYLRPWSRAGAKRIYLSDDQNSPLGWKNLTDGTVTVTAEADRALAEGLLSAATGSGLQDLRAKDVPRVGTDLPLRWKLVTAGTISRAYIVGTRWQRSGTDRLYGTYACRAEGVHQLGYIDLGTGMLHAVGTTPLNKNLRPAESYLKRLHLNYERVPKL